MVLDDLIKEIKVDLGSDICTLGISDESIELKIKESLRKVASYAPYSVVQTFDNVLSSIELPDGTCTVIQCLTEDTSTSTDRNSPAYDEQDLFNATRYIYNYNSLSDPYIYMMKASELKTLQNMISLSDWYYNKENHTVYFNNPPSTTITIRYLRKYLSVEEISDPDILQTVKEYALALCKIIEGNIRRKLQNAPGAVSMDGDSLVSEGSSEKSKLDDWIPKQYANIRFGLRA